MTGSLLLAGCGKMGGAMLAGWLKQGLAAETVTVVEPTAEAAAQARALGVRVVATADEVAPAGPAEVVVLAVKPQAMDEAALPLRRFVGGPTVVLSIAAGTTLAAFAGYFGATAAVVRVMPNTPAAIGRGMLVACPNTRVTAAQRARCQALLAAVGEVAWIADESLMDAVTAVSGSGPAYVFLLIECLAEAGVQAGLPSDLAMQLARVTVGGAGELACRSGEPPAVLRRNVTSPGGTTQAALEVLMASEGLQPLLTRAVAAAARRSRELAG